MQTLAVRPESPCAASGRARKSSVDHSSHPTRPPDAGSATFPPKLFEELNVGVAKDKEKTLTRWVGGLVEALSGKWSRAETAGLEAPDPERGAAGPTVHSRAEARSSCTPTASDMNTVSLHWGEQPWKTHTDEAPCKRKRLRRPML